MFHAASALTGRPIFYTADFELKLFGHYGELFSYSPHRLGKSAGALQSIGAVAKVCRPRPKAPLGHADDLD